jgi:hypothetical protein
MAQHPKIVFVSTGGAIPGHDEKTFARFSQAVENSPHRNRYVLHGWVPTEDVPNYYLEANVALNIDRWSIEGEVGYRTRTLDWIMAYIFMIFPIAFSLMTIRIIQVNIMKHVLKIEIAVVDKIDTGDIEDEIPESGVTS